MSIKPAKLVWAGMPGSACNLNCSYCYSGSVKGERGVFRYPVEHMLKCFTPDRFGGPIFFGGAAAGETLLIQGIVEFTRGMLEMGHVVSYTTNMTYSPVIDQFCSFPEELKNGLQLDASLHYNELKQTGKLNVYFENLRKLHKAGVSIALFLCITEEYLPHLKEIRELCKREIGLLPVAGMMRKYTSQGAQNSGQLPDNVDDIVHSCCDYRQWDLQKKVYGRKRNEYCHAGQLSINLSLSTGNYTKCWGNSGQRAAWERMPFSALLHFYREKPRIGKMLSKVLPDKSQVMGNIFDLGQSLVFEPMESCPFYDCVCASYLCWGLIPGNDAPTHSQTYFHSDFVSEKVYHFMNCKLIPGTGQG